MEIPYKSTRDSKAIEDLKYESVLVCKACISHQGGMVSGGITVRYQEDVVG